MGLLKRHELSFEAGDPRPGAHSAKRRVREVLEMLTSQDQATRAHAMDVLGRADEIWAAFFELSAVGGLVEINHRMVGGASQTEEEQPARSVFRALGPKALPFLLQEEVLGSEEAWYGVTVGLAEVGAPAVAALSEVLREGRSGSTAHRNAVIAMGYMEPTPETALELLQWVVRNDVEDPAIRQEAAYWWRHAAPDATADELTQTLLDEHEAEQQRKSDELTTQLKMLREDMEHSGLLPHPNDAVDQRTSSGKLAHALEHNLPVVVQCHLCGRDTVVAKKGIRASGPVVVLDAATRARAARYCATCRNVVCAACVVAQSPAIGLGAGTDMPCPICGHETIVAEIGDLDELTTNVVQVLE